MKYIYILNIWMCVCIYYDGIREWKKEIKGLVWANELEFMKEEKEREEKEEDIKEKIYVQVSYIHWRVQASF